MNKLSKMDEIIGSIIAWWLVIMVGIGCLTIPTALVMWSIDVICRAFGG